MDQKDWISIKNNIVISDDIKAVHCDTRDFHVLLNTEQPKVEKDVTCNYDKWCNQGLSKFYKIVKKQTDPIFQFQKPKLYLGLQNFVRSQEGLKKTGDCLCLMLIIAGIGI